MAFKQSPSTSPSSLKRSLTEAEAVSDTTITVEEVTPKRSPPQKDLVSTFSKLKASVARASIEAQEAERACAEAKQALDASTMQEWFSSSAADEEDQEEEEDTCAMREYQMRESDLAFYAQAAEEAKLRLSQFAVENELGSVRSLLEEGDAVTDDDADEADVDNAAGATPLQQQIARVEREYTKVQSEIELIQYYRRSSSGSGSAKQRDASQGRLDNADDDANIPAAAATVADEEQDKAAAGYGSDGDDAAVACSTRTRQLLAKSYELNNHLMDLELEKLRQDQPLPDGGGLMSPRGPVCDVALGSTSWTAPPEDFITKRTSSLTLFPRKAVSPVMEEEGDDEDKDDDDLLPQWRSQFPSFVYDSPESWRSRRSTVDEPPVLSELKL